MSCELCKESYLDSYNVAVDTLTRENPAFSPHEIRVRAAMQFRPIFHAMEVGSAIENIGEREYKNGEFSLTPEGEMYFLNTGQKADQLHINQQRSSELTNDPTKYSVTDHQTTRLIQHAIAHGATIVRTSFARDGQNNRDIIEYQYDRLTNRGVIKVINTVDNGAQHDFNSIKEITRQRSQRLTEIAPLENVFIFTDAQLRQDRVRSVVLTSRGAQPPAAQSIQPEGQKQAFPTHEAFIREEVRVIDGVRGNMFMDTSRIVFHDSREAIRGIAVFLRDKEKRREGIDRIRRVFARGKKLVDNHNAAAFSLSMGQKDERLTIEKIREKPVRIVTAIETRHAQMRKSAAALVVAAETKVAVGAAPLILASLVQEQPKDFRAVEKSIKRHRKKEVRMKKNELRKAKREMKRKPVVEVVDNIKEQKERRKERRKRKKVYMRHPAGIRIYTFKFNEQRKRRENGGNKIAVAEVLPPLISQKREKRERRRIKRLRRVMSRAERVLEAKLVPKKERKLWVALAVAAAEFRGTARPHYATAQRRQRSERRGAWRGKPMNGEMKQWNNEAVHIDRAIAGVGFGWVLWMLLMRKHNETPKNNFKRSHPASQGETLRRQEETPWILLSIIWYLTMLREQGMQTNQTNPTPAKQDPAPQDNTTNQNKRVMHGLLPKYGVIFLHAS